MVDSEGRYSTEKQDSVQSVILYDCEFHGFRSVKVLKFDTPPGGSKKCPEAEGGSVEACQFLHDEAEVMSNSRSAQSSPVKSSIGFWLSLLRSTSCLSPRTIGGSSRPNPNPKRKRRDRFRELGCGMDWTDERKQDFVGKGLHQYLGKRRSRKDLRNLDKDDIYQNDKIVSWAMSVL
ncbi:hypothetical protein F2Q68_00037536 [Brassica cretica]|uniref:Uncharacterized protein n=1 Tax=Brassica cretica TaxID=69181 RepID=A0A8S9H3W5_BRACR|nr:hypothetical protein F2Q68_00037536 [Brassica cretica]